MPFKSQAQRRLFWAKDPAMARRWEKETPPGKLPEHVSKGSTKLAEPPPPKGISAKKWDKMLEKGSVGDIDDLEGGDPIRLMPYLRKIHKLGSRDQIEDQDAQAQSPGRVTPVGDQHKEKDSFGLADLFPNAGEPNYEGPMRWRPGKLKRSAAIGEDTDSLQAGGLQKSGAKKKRRGAVRSVLDARKGHLLGGLAGGTLGSAIGAYGLRSMPATMAGALIGTLGGSEAGGALLRAHRRRRREKTKTAYRLRGHTDVQGLRIAIENRKGDVRRGTSRDGHKWETRMRWPYGYIVGTEGKDGEAVDAYVGPDKEAPKAFVVHQHKPDGTGYDEDKVMLGFRSKKEAKEAYLKHYDSDKFLGPISIVSMDRLRELVKSKKKLVKISHVEPMVQEIVRRNRCAR